MTSSFPSQQGTVLCFNCHESFAPSSHSIHECNALAPVNGLEGALSDTACEFPTHTTLYTEAFDSSPRGPGSSLRSDTQDTIVEADQALLIAPEPWSLLVEQLQNAENRHQSLAEFGDNESIPDMATSYPGCYSTSARESDF